MKGDENQHDADQLARLLEIELMGKRAAWRQTNARRGTWRALSFLFLFLVIAGAAVALYVVFTMRSGSPQSQPGTSPPATWRP